MAKWRSTVVSPGESIRTRPAIHPTTPRQVNGRKENSAPTPNDQPDSISNWWVARAGVPVRYSWLTMTISRPSSPRGGIDTGIR